MTAPVIANSAAPVGIVLIDPATGLPYSAAGGGVAFSAGTNSFSSGTLVLSNSNGITFGMGTNGVITATVTPGAAAGIAAVQLPNTTYTSGTVNFLNSNGLSFGSTTGGGVTASYTVPAATVFSNSNNVSFGLNGSTVTATATLPIGIGGAAAGTQTGTSGTLVFANSNGLTFGMSGSSQVTGSYTVPAATVFSNSNNVSFGLAGSTVTATATFAGGGGAAISAAGSSQSVGTVVFSNSNGVSFGMNGSTITATVTPGAAAGVAAAAAGTQTQTTGTLNFVNSNGLTFGMSGSSQLTASYTVPGATVFSNSNNVSFGLNGSTITATATVAQTNQSLGIYGSSQTTGQSSSSTVDARSLSVVGAGVISVGMSGGSLLISAPGTTGLTQLSAGMSTGGNTTGTTGLASAQLVLAGGSNITLSGSTNAGSMTITVVGGAGGASVNFSAGTTSNNLGTVVFSNSNGVSFGQNGSTITGSVAAQTNQSLGLYASSQTVGQSSSSTVDARSLTVVGMGDLSVGLSGGSLILSHPTGDFNSAGVSNIGNTAGNTGLVSQQLVLAGGNNITLSQSTVAGGNGTVTISGANQTNQTVGLYAVGNTTQNSSTTLDARTLSFDALGAMTVGYSNGSVQLSVPVTSSLSATGQVSISTNGSTISIGVPSYGTLSYWDNQLLAGSMGGSQLGQGSVVVQPLVLEDYLSISALREFISVSLSSSSNSSYAGTVSIQGAIYTKNASTLSLASSGSQSYAFTNTSNNSTASLSGMRGLTLPLNASLTPGNYWVALWSSTASANANWFTISNVVQSQAGLTYSGLLGVASNATNQISFGGGIWSTTSAAIPSSIAFAAITGIAANLIPGINLYNMTA